MIKPHPEADLNKNLMVIGAKLIELLNNKRRKRFLVEDVLLDFLKKHQDYTPLDFFYTLSYLYTLDIIEENNYKVCLKK